MATIKIKQVRSKIGRDLLYRYFEAFGLFSKTGVDTAGEAQHNK